MFRCYNKRTFALTRRFNCRNNDSFNTGCPVFIAEHVREGPGRGRRYLWNEKIDKICSYTCSVASSSCCQIEMFHYFAPDVASASEIIS